MSDFAASLAAGAAALGHELDATAVERLVGWRDLVADWNRSANLVADADEALLLERHLLDSLAHLAALDWRDGPLIDVGSGGGLPGLILAIAYPDRPVTLVESAARKADFLRLAAAELGLAEVTVREVRAEALGREVGCREAFARATARRLAPLAVLLEYLLPLVSVGGWMVVAKGVGLDDELAAAAGVAEQLGGGAPEFVVGPRDRRFVRVAKLAPTPERFPRRVGVPSRRPLRGQEG